MGQGLCSTDQVGTHRVPMLPRDAASLLPGLQRAGADDRLALCRGVRRELVRERKVSVSPTRPPFVLIPVGPGSHPGDTDPNSVPARRGLIMGIWNSHTSVGNILGSLIAGVWVSSAWGLSFIVPGIVIAAVGIICFFFLVECEWRDPGGTADDQRNTKSSGTAIFRQNPISERFWQPQRLIASLWQSRDVDPTTTGMLSTLWGHPGRLSPCAGHSSQPVFLGNIWEALWDFIGVFRCREAGTRRCSPAPGGSQPHISPLQREMLEGERVLRFQALTGSPFSLQIPRTSAAVRLCIT